MSKVHIHVHTSDDAEAKAKVQALINEASALARKMSSAATAGGAQNKFLREAQTTMSAVISALQEAKGVA